MHSEGVEGYWIQRFAICACKSAHVENGWTSPLVNAALVSAGS